MPLISTCLCGSSGPFTQFVPIEGMTCARCSCGVEHQVTEQTREEYEAQYVGGAYHASVDRHPGCIRYRDRYEHDYKVAAQRFQRYDEIIKLGRLVTALDVGCANCAFVDYLRDRGMLAWGVEPDPAMARQYVSTGSLQKMNGAHRFFDLITFHDVLEHIVDPYAELVAAAARLRKGGAVVVDVPDVSTTAGHHHYKPEHVWFFTAQSLALLFARTGLRATRFDYPVQGKLVVYGEPGA